MIKKIHLLIALLFAISSGIAISAEQTAPAQTVDEKADQLMHKMSDLMAHSKSFTFKTKERHDRIRPSGKKVQVEVSRETSVRRPDGVWMHAITQAPDLSRQISLWYDGKTLTLQSDKEKVYAHTKMPPTIDETIDFVGSTLDIPTPMADVLYSSPYDAFMSPDTTGGYVKLDKIEGTQCHQLAFQNSMVDWSIWIADGERPLLRKLEIIYKLDEGSPKASMTFFDWNFEAQIAEGTFSHQPPADYQKIQIVGRAPMETEQPAQTQPEEKQ